MVFIASTMIFRNKSFKYLSIISFLFFLSGCSVWENFTTYYNLYYNTKTLFEDAETEILKQRTDIFSNDPLIPQGNSKNTLIKVIEKSSKILQFNANSSYVDDALMLLGKSFFYQGNYQKAKRKFEELLATNIDDDEEILEAQLWIAKCMFSLREDEDAYKMAEQVRSKAVEEDYGQLIKDSYIEEIKYHLRKDNLPQAINLANEFAEVYDDTETRAEVYFELGKLYTLTGDNDNAILAYEKVFDNSPDFDMEIETTIKYADALREAGQFDKALEAFEEMRKEDKFKESFNEVDFEIGKTLVQLGRYDEAANQFRMVDSTYKNTPFAAASNFELGRLYQNQYANFDSAAFFYSMSVKGNPPKDYVDKAKNNNQLFGRYQKLRKDLSRFNRQLYYSENPDIFIKDSTAYVEDSLKILTDYLEKKELQDIWKSATANLQAIDSTKIIDSTLIRDTLVVKDSLMKVDSLMQIGLYNSQDTVGLRQKIFQDLKQKRILAKNLQNKNAVQLQNQMKADNVGFRNNPPQRLKIPVDSARTLLAKNSLELGNLFLAELNKPDSAYSMYNEIINEYPAKSYYPNTLYALGSYFLTINEKQKADSLFRIIYDNYKDRNIVNAAANKLSLPLIDLSFDPAKDLYATAENEMLEGNYNQSINNFYSIYKDYPKSPFAPQALYASGWILENNLELSDSAASVYDTLNTKYPSSLYAKNILKKLVAYKQEKAKIEKALQDSLATIQKLQADSSVIASNTTEEQLQQLDQEVVDKLENEIKKPEEKEKVAQINGTASKRLEPLWDPRKHFH